MYLIWGSGLGFKFIDNHIKQINFVDGFWFSEHIAFSNHCLTKYYSFDLDYAVYNKLIKKLSICSIAADKQTKWSTCWKWQPP